MLGIITDSLIRKLFERIAGIGYGEAETGFLDHGEVVVAIANRDHVCDIHTELFSKCGERFALARIGGIDLKVVCDRICYTKLSAILKNLLTGTNTITIFILATISESSALANWMKLAIGAMSSG